ncbi:hypothetical protein D3878_02850 [Noviherbaspirillum sedimenti]|uniref:Uncharacterized protein n=2 Tax=Noviherbaspirillum sedimenti TaxID=2320865 RepID=A0A3A3FYE9_9BURK|nr:hypothetical protein D3878_02850 [Noviherbaspirillum sedimenti]
MTEPMMDPVRLKQMCAMRVEVLDPDYEVVEIVAGGEFLYDPQVFWDWKPDNAWGKPEGSILISDIGGQQQPGWDPAMGHGALYRLHADNRLETIMAPGAGRQAGVFRPIIAPEGWGDWGGHIFFCSQIIPGRRGAVVDHMIYRLGPGDDKPHGFGIPPRAGSLGGGISGALMPGVFGRPGTPEEGLLLIISMHNCTIYAVRPDATIEPWIVMDGVNGPGPLMPYRLYYADPEIAGEPNMLVVEGSWGTHFGVQNRTYKPGHYRVVGRTVEPESVAALSGGMGHRAPAGFGHYAGQMFRPENHGFISSVHWTAAEPQALPYSAEIIRRDADGKEHVFATNLQAGQNLLGFTNNRLIITNVRHSYSSGNFHEPDGSIYAIQYKGA